MLKSILTAILILLGGSIALAQKTFNVTIKLDSSIVLRDIQYQYYNGKKITFQDSTNNKSTIVLKGVYYSPQASINVGYSTGGNYYSNDFFIDEKPATITLHYLPNKDNNLNYTFIENATSIFDTTINKIWAKRTAFLNQPDIKQQNEAFDKFMQNNKGFAKSDSLSKIFNKLYAIYLNQTMDFIKPYPNDYFSFWFFINQICQLNRNLGKDIPYLEHQLAFVKAVFPEKFTQSEEGKNLINNYKIALKPVYIKRTAPPLNITTIDGKKLSLASLKGKYVLLDFWATWCPPCMAEMPFIKEIRKKYPPEKLAIIGISLDRNLKTMKETIAKTGMNWIHYFDEDSAINDLYHVNAIPTLALIDKTGKLIYKTDFKMDDKVEVTALLNAME
ncbi:MAG: TlpA disulfide reductase family protein [Bacteroidota bacterium]